MIERKVITTVKETIKFEDTYYRMGISKTDGKVLAISISGRSSRGRAGERVLYLSKGMEDRSQYSLEAKVEELRDLFDIALKELAKADRPQKT